VLWCKQAWWGLVIAPPVVSYIFASAFVPAGWWSRPGADASDESTFVDGFMDLFPHTLFTLAVMVMLIAFAWRHQPQSRFAPGPFLRAARSFRPPGGSRTG
jgi:hypothetical protein